MADKGLRPAGLAGARNDEEDREQRRAFLKRAALAGVPVVLATVHGRSALGQEIVVTASGCASLNPSGWRARNYGSVEDADVACSGVESQPLEQPLAQEEPFINLTPSGPGNSDFGKSQGNGKGGPK